MCVGQGRRGTVRMDGGYGRLEKANGADFDEWVDGI